MPPLGILKPFTIWPLSTFPDLLLFTPLQPSLAQAKSGLSLFWSSRLDTPSSFLFVTIPHFLQSSFSMKAVLIQLSHWWLLPRWTVSLLCVQSLHSRLRGPSGPWMLYSAFLFVTTAQHALPMVGSTSFVGDWFYNLGESRVSSFSKVNFSPRILDLSDRVTLSK